MNEFIESLLIDLRNLSAPYVLFQFGVVIVCFLFAHIAARFTKPRLNRWLAKRSDWPLWVRKFLFSLIKHIRLIYFFCFTSLARLIMLQVTWSARSYFIKLAATIAMAMILVLVVSRLIRNDFLRRVFKWGAWIAAIIYLTGYFDSAIEVLDAIAIDIGNLHISLFLIIKTVLALIIFVALARILQLFLTTRIENINELTPSERVLMQKIVSFTLFALAVIFGIRLVGLDLSNFALLSGAIGVGIGFGLQKVVSNLVSGVILLIDKSIKPGDVISIDKTFGWITHLGSRYVSVNTRDGKTFLIPNEDLITGQVVNWTHSSELVRLDIFFGVSYNADPHEVRRICREAAAKVKRVSDTPAPVCHIVGFGDNSVDFILRFWIRDPTAGLTNVRGDVYLSVWDTLKEANIEIPFPQRDVHIISQPAPPLESAGQPPETSTE